jgi:hypothetical protein
LTEIFPYYCRIDKFLARRPNAASLGSISEEKRDLFTAKMVDFLKLTQRQLRDLQNFYENEINSSHSERDSLGSVVLDMLRASVPSFGFGKPSLDAKMGRSEEIQREPHHMNLLMEGILSCLESHLALVTNLFVKMQRSEKQERLILSNYKR